MIGALVFAGDAVLAGNATSAGDTTQMGRTASGTKSPPRQGGVLQQTATHRQLSDCMTKRMAASRTISYNDAAKVCKDQLGSQQQALSARNAAQAAAATAH
jgi:hypothetical protein